MLNCPHCNHPMQQDPNDPSKALCYNCRKRFDARKVAEWQAANTTSAHIVDAPVEQHPQQIPSAYPPDQPAQYSQVPPQSHQESHGAANQYDPACIYGEQASAKLPKGCAIASLVLGIVALLNCWLPVLNAISVLLGIIALILGFVSLRKSKNGTGSGRGMGIAGIVTSIVGIVASIAISSLFIAGVNAALSEMDSYSYDDYMSEITSEIESEINGYGGSASDGYDDMSPWTKLKFELNGKPYALMESTLADLEESGYVLDLEGQGYPDGYSVEPGQMISVIELEGENDYDEYFIVNVANLSEDPMDIKECVLTKFDYDNAGDSKSVSIDGISCGATEEEVVEVFGEPQDSEENDPYVLYQYETRKYTKYFQVIFADGVVKGFTLSSMEY